MDKKDIAGPPAVPVPQPQSCYPRLEIDTLVKDADALNIFLLAIADMQINEKNGAQVWKDDPHSWFQMAGELATNGIPKQLPEARC
jgi:hypothetical protein